MPTLRTGRIALLLSLALALPASAAFAHPEHIYWIDTSLATLKRADLDGNNVETLLSVTTPNGVAIDPIAGHVYWIECCGNVNGKIRRADLDGSNAVTVYSGDLAFPQRLDVDPVNERIYWTDSSSQQLRRVNYDGMAVTTLIDPNVPFVPIGIAVDRFNGHLYFTESSSGSAGLYRSDADGSNVVALLTAGDGDEIGDPHGIVLDVVGGKMYWTDQARNEVRRADLDGNGSEVLLDFASNGMVDPIGIGLDLANGKLYVSDLGADKIVIANLDGSGGVDLITSGVSFPRSLAVDPGPIQIPLLPTGAVVALGALAALAIAVRTRP